MYIPLLENLIYHINPKLKNQQTVRWISDLKIRWSSALTSSSVFHLNGPKLYQVNDMNFELRMILSLYGAILRDRALEISPSGKYISRILKLTHMYKGIILVLNCKLRSCASCHTFQTSSWCVRLLS